MSIKSNLIRKKNKDAYMKEKKYSLESAKRDGTSEKLISRIDKSINNDKVIFRKNPHKEKASKIIIDFAKPFIDESISNAEIESSLSFAIIAWNIAVFPDDVRKKEIDNAIYLFKFDEEQKVMLEELLLRKKELFNQYNFYVIDFELNFNKLDVWNLSVAVARIND